MPFSSTVAVWDARPGPGELMPLPIAEQESETMLSLLAVVWLCMSAIVQPGLEKARWISARIVAGLS